jgi:tRNA A-37 threonylcarbamoyl transferase component Bud32
MGTVFMAEQEHPVRRRVAVKLVKPGMDSAAVGARFEAERQALAMMDHPNIAKVLDAGTTDAGRPFFVMELVNGIPVTRYCDENKLTPRDRLALFVPVCQAIQHAHQKGVIHRDVKPSNVLVTLYDGKPVPKVIDFGIAKATEQRLTDRTMFTQFGMAVGTFEYMAPEQAELSGLGVDTRADVYSLGVLLYELLTGTTPLEANRLRGVGYSEAVRLIREEEAPAPSRRLSTSAQLQSVAAARRTEPARLARLVRGELDWIVMKCLEKDRTRRYGSAEALARDVERYLHDEPVEACPPSVWYRVRKVARKHTGALAVVAVVIAALVAGVAVSTWQAVEATRAKHELRAGMTRQVAERIQGDLGRFAAVGDALGATAIRRGDWTEDQLGGWMRDMLLTEPEIYGLCLAFEPDKGPVPRPGGYHLYKSRPGARGTGVVTTPLRYVPQEQEWYRLARTAGRPAWTEPFVDTGGGEIPMVSYVAPLRRRVGRRGDENPADETPADEFVGVLTVDLSLRYFDRLRDWLKDLKFGPRSYGFVVSQEGNVLSHRDPDYDFGQRFDAGHKSARRITSIDGADPAFTDLAGRMRREPGGRGRATDPSTGRPATFLFARVQLDRTHADREWWSFVAVIEE